MIKIKLTTTFPKWPLARQTPHSQSVWGNCQFFVNQNIEKCDYWVVFEGLKQEEKVICPKENTIFVTGEPASVKKYNSDFLKQFGVVITSQRNIKHPNTIYTQQALPWMIGGKFIEKTSSWRKNYSKNYDELKAITDIKKDRLISVITSKKEFTKGHQQRLKFTNELKKHFGENIDVFGRDINNFVDKWDVIAPYKYHIALENSSYKDYWTEKLSDAFLAGAYPIYYGCPNIYDYFSKNSLATIDIKKPKEAIKIIEKIISTNQYEKSKKEIAKAKNLILDKYNFFPMISNIIINQLRQKKSSSKGEIIIIEPESYYFNKISKKIVFFEKIYQQTNKTLKTTKGKIGRYFNKITRYKFCPINKRNVYKWKEARGDETLRINYNLDNKSIVFDVGGYKGEWSEKIFDRYKCNIYIFEPIKEFFDNINKKFSNNKKIRVFNFGLSKENKFVDINIDNDSSSVNKDGDIKEKVQFRCISSFIKEYNVQNIDLMKINIEGDEYDLLNNLIDSGLVKNIQNIQVQFHNFVPNAKERMKKIQNKLSLTHKKTYQYLFVWENWTKNI